MKKKVYGEFGVCDNGFEFDCPEEAEIYKQLKEEGYTVRKYGWPDFLVTKGNEVRLIEVKSKRDWLKRHQRDVIHAFAKLGITVEIVSYGPLISAAPIYENGRIKPGTRRFKRPKSKRRQRRKA